MDRNTTHSLQVDAVTRKLAILRKRDPHLIRFGASTHRYELRSVLTELEITEIEHACGIRLPEDYRQFLLHIGDVGASPGYGLISLLESVHMTPSDRLAYAFPLTFTQPQPRTDPRLTAPGNGSTEPADDLDPLANDSCRPDELAAWVRYSREWADERTSSTSRHPLIASAQHEVPLGTLAMAWYGCGILAALVVKGAELGTIWISDPNESWGHAFYPIGAGGWMGRADWDRMAASPDKRLGFLDWYEDWLDGELVALDEVESERWEDDAPPHMDTCNVDWMLDN